MAAVAETYTINTEKNINNVASILSLPQVLSDEDGDSRDSGISIGSCTDVEIDDDIEKAVLKLGEVTSTAHRQALVDCSNLLTKTLVNSSSKASIFPNDTPTSRKGKSVFSSESVDQSEYEKVQLQQQESNKNHARHLNMDDCTQLSRKRNSSASSCSAVQKRSRSTKLPGENEDDGDDVFFNFEPPLVTIPTKPLPSSVSLWDVSTAHSHRNNVLTMRKTSDDSFNASTNSISAMASGSIKTHRAMSVGFIEPDAPLPETLEVRYSLPSVERPQKESQAYRSIAPTTLLSEFIRLGGDFHSTYVVVDCRYPFEFHGGHVKGAVNIYHASDIDSFFFAEDPLGVVKKRIPIFYCEYSQKRGPTMANKLRSIDRVRNELKYPHVEYPEIYLLDHGYRALWSFESCQEICEPRDYIPMDKPEFLTQLRSFRGARHRSNASSVKSTSDLTSVGSNGGSLRKLTTRNLRKNASMISVRSKLTSSCSFGSEAFLDLSTDDPLFNCDPFDSDMGKKSISNFEISSTSSEVDIDVFIGDKAVASSSAEETRTVQVAMKFKSPEFNPECMPVTPTDKEFKEPNASSNKGTPRACLDFSSISDTD